AGRAGQAAQLDVGEEMQLAIAAAAADALREDAVRAGAPCLDEPVVGNGDFAAGAADAAAAAQREAEAEVLRALDGAGRHLRGAVAASAAATLAKVAVRASAFHRDDAGVCIHDGYGTAGAARAAGAAAGQAELGAAAFAVQRELCFEVAVAPAAADGLRLDTG